MYTIGRPYYAKFGAIGTIIGHELTHAFFAQSVQDRWTNNTRLVYENKTTCVIQEFKNFTQHEKFFAVSSVSSFLFHHLFFLRLGFWFCFQSDPDVSLRENIADLMGPEIAYAAYQEWSKDVQEAKLPGFDYTPNQLFWIMSGICKCHPPGATNTFDQEHSTPSFLVNFSKRNSWSFAADYACPEKSQMNSADKCHFL